MGKFSVRIVVCDHYMVSPTLGLDVTSSEFRGSEVKHVPVIRIFGPAADGFKTCLHVHGVFPYFYIPCANSNPKPQFLYQIANSIDKALNISLKQATSQEQHVYKISLVRGIPFYGYHTREHLFFKIFLYNPNHIKHAVELFQNGAILGQVFQAYEAHLNFTLQFFIDFNLFGMSCVDLRSVKFRRKCDPNKTGDSTFDDAIVEGSSMESIKPLSKCFYEIDCLAYDILNRQRVDKHDGQDNPGLEAVWNEEKERRKKINISLNQALSPSQSREGIRQTDTHEKFKSIFLQRMLLYEKELNSQSSPMTLRLPSTQQVSTAVGAINILNQSIYPVEHSDTSICSIANDVIFHHPFGSPANLDLTQDISMNDTIVDEALALSCSLSQGKTQVTLGSDDLAFMEMLGSMDDKIDEDSIIASQINQQMADNDNSTDSDDYTKTFEEHEIAALLSDNLDVTMTQRSDSNILRDAWEDSFWEGVDNIPQLDGSSDDIGHNSQLSGKYNQRTRNKSLGVARNRSNKPKKKREIFNIPKEKAMTHEICDNSSPDQLKTISVESADDVLSLNSKEPNINLSHVYDLQHNFFPQATGSGVQSKRNSFDQNASSISDAGIVSFYDMTLADDLSLIDQSYTHTQEALTKRKSQEEIASLITKKTKSSMKFIKSEKGCVLRAASFGPTPDQLQSTLKDFDLPQHTYLEPFYSNFNDVTRRIEVGSTALKLLSNSVFHLKDFDSSLPDIRSIEEWRKELFLTNSMSQILPDINNLDLLLASNRRTVLRTVLSPPSANDVHCWVADNLNSKSPGDSKIQNDHEDNNNVELDSGQNLLVPKPEVSDPSQHHMENEDIGSSGETVFDNSLYVSKQPDGSFLCHDFLSSQESHLLDKTGIAPEPDFLTIMSVELHSNVRGNLNPDPEFDEIQAIFYKITNDCPKVHTLSKEVTGIIVIDNYNYKLQHRPILKDGTINYSIDYVNNESELIATFLKIFHQADPDIICGFEIEMQSWGYLIERSQNLGINMISELSRVQTTKKQHSWRNSQESNDLKFVGRVAFSLWRLLRHEVALSSYSFENAMFHVLNERVPLYSFKQLAEWWNHDSHLLRWNAVEFYMTRLCGTFRMMDEIDLIKRTSELARLFGLQWWEVFSRGSQFRVESMMLRAARPLNLVAYSPSVSQRATMKAPECLPLIFEPESRFYSDPVIVLDFQSLYPSMMIAYNYCFSTCIGRVQQMGRDSAYEFGAWQLRISRDRLKRLASKDAINWSPVGVGFVKASVRRGVLPTLLKRILAARLAVKNGIKFQTDEAVKRAMHARQLGLKLIANVTYGYTAANFSGRMPCVEVADSVVSKGRETLEKAIKLVEQTKKWDARVVYGDTDSMFVLVKGRSRAEAFEIGAEIAAAVTADNPSPVALKLEKVYQPCILQTKKRYVGYLYESVSQQKPEFQAKGIETVRRDGCPASVKLLEEALRELFDSRDMSKVRSLVCNKLSSLIEGTMPILDLVFTREFHGMKGYKNGASAPPFEIAKRLLSFDRRAVPRLGERVGWVVTAGAPGSALIHLARSRNEMVGCGLQPHVAYYITRAILPPLARCLSLVGANVFQWYEELPRRHNVGVGGIAQYLWKETCSACGVRTLKTLCDNCMKQPSQTMFALQESLRNYSAKHRAVNMICLSCCGNRQIESCVSTECPVFWRRATSHLDYKESLSIMQEITSE